MAASSVKIFDISDIGPVGTAGGDVTNLQEAAEKGLGTFLEVVGTGLSSRYLTKLVDAGFDAVRTLAVDEEKLIKYAEMLPGHAIRVSEAAIEVVSGKPGSIREGIDGPTPGEVDSRRLAGSAPLFPNDPIPPRSKVEAWWAQTTAWTREWSESVANYLVELKVDVNKSQQIYSKYRFTQEQNNYAGNKLIQAFHKSDHVMHLFTRSQKDKPTLITLMTVIALTHFPQDAEHKTKLRNKFNDFPSCKDKSKLLGQFNSWCDLYDELEHMNQMIVKDDEAVLASFKRLIAQIDEIQQVMTMSKNLLKKELTLHELQEITKVEATKWSREASGKKTNPTQHPTPKPHNKTPSTPKEHVVHEARGKREGICPHWGIATLRKASPCGHGVGGCRLGYKDVEGHPPHLENTNPQECYDQLKSQPCRDWKVGKCERGDTCLFGHANKP